jgi:hypothetical protein
MKITKESELLNLEDVMAFAKGDTDYFDLPQSTQDALYEYYASEMPYGVQKARTGDPDVWIAKRLDMLSAAATERLLRSMND